MKTHIYVIVIIFMLLFGIEENSFTQNCYWSSQAGGILVDGGTDVISDWQGNTYVIGWTISPYCYFQTDTLRWGSFLIKYNPLGNEEWVIELRSYNPQPGEYLLSDVSSMVYDTINNHILLTGNFYNYLYLPDTTLHGDELTIFLARLDTDGHTIWARTAGGTGEDEAFGLTYDNQSNIYISGASDRGILFDQVTIPRGGFLAKYDLNGNLIWAKNKFRYYESFPGSSNWPFTEAPPFNLSFSDNSVFVNGFTRNDTIIIDTVQIYLGTVRTAFLARFTREGDIIWFSPAGGPKSYSGKQLAVNSNGTAYMTGIFEGAMGIFGDDTLYSQASYCDGFLSKLDPTGEFVWTAQMFATGEAWGRGLALDQQGNIYLSAWFSGMIQCGPEVITSGSSRDMFLAKYSPDGGCLGIRHYSRGYIPRIDIDREGNIGLAGHFENTLDIGGNVLTSRGESDLFAAKCSPITGVPQPLDSPTNTLLIYANPNTGQCTVTIPEEFRNEKNLQLQIFDQTGRLIQEARMEMVGESVKLDISAQAKGIYLAVLSNGKKSFQGKIVFE